MNILEKTFNILSIIFEGEEFEPVAVVIRGQKSATVTVPMHISVKNVCNLPYVKCDILENSTRINIS